MILERNKSHVAGPSPPVLSRRDIFILSENNNNKKLDNIRPFFGVIPLSAMLFIGNIITFTDFPPFIIQSAYFGCVLGSRTLLSGGEFFHINIRPFILLYVERTTLLYLSPINYQRGRPSRVCGHWTRPWGPWAPPPEAATKPQTSQFCLLQCRPDIPKASKKFDGLRAADLVWPNKEVDWCVWWRVVFFFFFFFFLGGGRGGCGGEGRGGKFGGSKLRRLGSVVEMMLSLFDADAEWGDEWIKRPASHVIRSNRSKYVQHPFFALCRTHKCRNKAPAPNPPPRPNAGHICSCMSVVAK